MKPAPFDYQAPGTLGEAVDLLASNPEALVIAGGQSLMPVLALGSSNAPASRSIVARWKPMAKCRMPATAYSAIGSEFATPREVVTTISLPHRSLPSRLLAPAWRW